MSNPTPKDHTVVASTVVTDATPTPAPDAPKAPGKVKTALRHPFQTIKRHSVVSTALIAGAVGVAGTLLLSKDDKDEDGGEDTTAPDDMDLPDNIVTL